MSGKNIRSRFAITFVANALRSLLNFATGLIIARSMGPERYGDLIFLLGSFEAIRQGVNMGTQNAFFTFISRYDRGSKFILFYCSWQLLQLVLTLITVGLLLPAKWFDMMWLGHDRGIVLLACIAVFFQSQAWQTMMQIGESQRLTFRVQMINIAVAVVHCIVVIVAAWQGGLAVKFLLILLSIEYLAALVVGYWLLPRDTTNYGEKTVQWEIGKWTREYAVYCTPLLFYNIGSFVYEFSDKWLLQHFGGAEQQGLYAVASQFSAACLLATTSMTRILWKEAAEFHQNGDYDGLRRIYEASSRVLYGFGAVIGGFLWPWSSDIVVVVLGESYREAWLPLAILFLYPMHQSLSQVMQILLMAIGDTMSFFWIGITFMIVSVPVTYFMLATSSAEIPGLGLGATGMAAKMLILNIIVVNAYVWYMCRKCKWKMSIGYQIVVFGWSVGAGGCAYWLVTRIPITAELPLLSKLIIAGVIYGLLQLMLLSWSPNLFGVPKEMLAKVGLGRVIRQ